MLEGRYIHIPRQKAQITLQTSLPPTFRNEVEERKERAERGQDERDCWCRTKCKKGKEKREETETERRNEKGDEKRTRKTRCKQEVEMNSARIFFRIREALRMLQIHSFFRFRRRFAKQLGHAFFTNR